MSKKVIEPINVLANGDMSTASLTSIPSTIKYMDNVSYQAIYTGSPVGSFDVQVSNDGTHWSSLGLNVAAANGTPQFINVVQLAAAQVRLIYTKVSGSGTLNVLMTAKEI